MRVIAGTAKGRRLQAGSGDAIRPTSDKVKGAIFSILTSRFELQGTRLLDLFSGAGALGIEALSRGARQVTFVDQSSRSIAVLQQNLSTCRLTERAQVMTRPVERALAGITAAGADFDGALLDPPYGKGLVESCLRALSTPGLIAGGGWVLVEHHVDETPATEYGALRLTQSRRYGKTCVALFTSSQTMPATTPETSKNRAVYAGSFDPITNGHLDVVRRATQVFDEVIVAVATGSSDPKKDRALFSADERVTMIRESLDELGIQAVADKFSGLLVDYCERRGARVIIRGLRAVSDFEYEFQMAMMNRHMKPGIETFFMTASEAYFYTASRLVKEVVGLGGNVKGLLPDSVQRELIRKLRH